MKLNPGFKKFIDLAGVIIALGADLTIIPICMWTIAPDLLTRIAFVMIGIVIVLFVFRSWATGWIALWLVFALVVFFFDYSFALATMKNKALVVTAEKNTEAVISADATISQLNLDIKDQKEAVKSYAADYLKPHTRATLDQIYQNQQVAQGKVDEYEAARTKRINEIKNSTASRVEMSSDDVFEAIPSAVREKRYMQLIVFCVIFIAIQAITVTSIEPDNRNKKENEIKEVIKEVVKEVPVEVTKEIEVEKPLPEFVENKDDIDAIAEWESLWRKNATSRKNQPALDLMDRLDRLLVGRKQYIDGLFARK
jgi:hypothetical protein